MGKAASMPMPETVQGRPVKQSALAIVLPSELAAVVDVIREKHDPAYPRWPAHINLIYGFVPEDQFNVALAAVTKVTRSFPSITVDLHEFVVFEHGKSASLVLKPTCSQTLIKLQHQLQKVFPNCTEQSRHDGGFRPHVTVGKCSSVAEANELKAQLEEKWADLQFQVKHVSFLARQADTPFRVVHEAPLSEAIIADLVAMTMCRTICIDDKTWAVGVRLHPEHPARMQRTPTRMHFVLDNSGSMGQNTRRAQECFSELVALASLPCSLTIFANSATLLGSDFATPEQMRTAALPRQGQTNITAGIERALQVICQHDHEDTANDTSTHHVLVLLSDGQHNNGTHPSVALPALGKALHRDLPKLRLSVVVVGVTNSSDTSMGMLLKRSLETVSLEALQPIYFAQTASGMSEVLGELSTGLRSLSGRLLRMSMLAAGSGDGFVESVGEDPVTEVTFMACGGEQHFLMKSSQGRPEHLNIDGSEVPCCFLQDFDVEFASDALQPLLARVRISRVAGQSDKNVQTAVQHLDQFVQAIEARCAEQKAAQGDGIRLARVSPQERVAQHKKAMGLLQAVKQLRNQMQEIEAFQVSSSAAQAAFLTGKSSKYGGKALLRAAANRAGGSTSASCPQLNTEQFLADLLADTRARGEQVKAALREDLQAKISTLSNSDRASLREALITLGVAEVAAVDSLCSGEVTPLTEKLLDSGNVVEPLQKVLGAVRHSYVSLNTAWEQLAEWCSSAADAPMLCNSEYQLLMFLGALGYPVDLRRRAATQMNPYAMEVLKVHTSLADTASLCCAMQSNEVLVPPEGGKSLEDLLVLVDPDSPKASRIIANSMLLRDAYTSVVLCRDLYMYSGNSMRIALHAHALLAAVQPPAEQRPKEEIVAELRRLHLGRSYQCGSCGFGPVSHGGCHDLANHHGEEDAPGSVVSNACPACDWFSDCLEDWEPWDGTVPESALPRHSVASVTDAASTAPVPCTEAALDLALRICYSARAIWSPRPGGEMQELCSKLENWEETITAADGVEHPVKLLLALAACDEVSEDCLGLPPTLALLNEVCARKAHDQIKAAGLDAHMRVRGFLGITQESAPVCAPLGEPEPQHAAVSEACCANYEFDTTHFDFEWWVWSTLEQWVPALRFVRLLRACLAQREGGWNKLGMDMETGPAAYADVIDFLKAEPVGAEQTKDQQETVGKPHSLLECLGVKSGQLRRTLATIAAQAHVHESSQSRRTKEAGGNLDAPLGDVRDGDTLRSLAVSLRMEIYQARVMEKMRQWQGLGAEMTCMRARVADLAQFEGFCGDHVHGLDKPTFWGLWHAAVREAKENGPDGEKVLAFMAKANPEFCNKHKPWR